MKLCLVFLFWAESFQLVFSISVLNEKESLQSERNKIAKEYRDLANCKTSTDLLEAKERLKSIWSGDKGKISRDRQSIQ